MSEHEEETQQVVYTMPCWKFSAWDVLGIAATTIGGFGAVLSQGLNLLSREFAAAANFHRQNYDLEQAQIQEEARLERDALVRAEMAEELRGIVEGPDEMVFDDTDGESEDDPS